MVEPELIMFNVVGLKFLKIQNLVLTLNVIKPVGLDVFWVVHLIEFLQRR